MRNMRGKGDRPGTERALEGLKVLEYGHFVSAPYCTKLLADLGADVIKVEDPRVGDMARKRGPFPNDVPHPEHSGLFLYINTNKLGVTLNLKTPTGRKIFKQLAEHTDILVENNAVGTMAELGLSFDDLQRVNQRLVMTSITPFGQTGPYKDYKAYYLNTFHAGGEGYTLPGGIGWQVYFDQPPIKSGGFVGEYASGVVAALASLAAVYGRELTSTGQYIDISQQEVLLGDIRSDINKYNYGWVESRATRSFPVGGLVPCKDGFVQIVPLVKHMWEGLLAVIAPEWLADQRFRHERLFSGYHGTAPVTEEIGQDLAKANQRLEEWCSQHSKDEIYHALQAKGCVASKVCTAEDLLNSEQLQGREFFKPVSHPETGQIRYAGAPYKFSITPWKIETPAPLLGQHNEEIYCGRLGYSKTQLVRMWRAGII